MLQRIHYENREAWLSGRSIGIGGSEAPAAVGMSPFSTQLELWKLKTGMVQPKDLSGNPAVQRGVRYEPILRGFFTAAHPEFTLEYHPYDILFQKERPWIFATLDGELLEENGRRGILEIKTASPRDKNGFAEWADGHIPDHYYIQCLHQLIATGFDFVNLFAALFSLDGTITLKPVVEIERNDVQEDIAWLLQQETEFWGKVKRGVMPATRLTL